MHSVHSVKSQCFVGGVVPCTLSVSPPVMTGATFGIHQYMPPSLMLAIYAITWYLASQNQIPTTSKGRMPLART